MEDFLSQREAEFCLAIIERLDGRAAYQAMLQQVRSIGMVRDAKPFLFELRFADALDEMGIEPEYEVSVLDETSIDFRYQGFAGREVLAELVSIGRSEAAQAGTTRVEVEPGIFFETLELRTNNDDPRISEEGEVLLVQQKICEKVFSRGRNVKFPMPTGDGPLHVIVVDMRGFLGGNGGDDADCVQLTFGNGSVSERERRYWTHGGVRHPIVGLYENGERPKGVTDLRQRVHGILFTRDTSYIGGGLLSPDSSIFVPNPHLLSGPEDRKQALHNVCGREPNTGA